MEQYIKKSALVSEIRKRLLPTIRDKHYDEWEEGQDSERIAILEILDTIEVKEVDLKKEVKRWKNEHGVYGMDDLDFIFGKHFYELGLKTQKSATHEWNLHEK